MKINDFFCRDLRVSRNVIEVWTKLGVVADWNLDQAYIAFCSSPASAAVRGRGYHTLNSLVQPVERSIRLPACFSSLQWVAEDCDASVSWCDFSNAGNSRTSELLKHLQDFVQCFLGRVFESLAHANDQRGISEGDNLHWR